MPAIWPRHPELPVVCERLLINQPHNHDHPSQTQQQAQGSRSRVTQDGSRGRIQRHYVKGPPQYGLAPSIKRQQQERQHNLPGKTSHVFLENVNRLAHKRFWSLIRAAAALGHRQENCPQSHWGKSHVAHLSKGRVNRRACAFLIKLAVDKLKRCPGSRRLQPGSGQLCRHSSWRIQRDLHVAEAVCEAAHLLRKLELAFFHVAHMSAYT